MGTFVRIALSGGRLFTLVDSEDADKVNGYSWCADRMRGGFYATTTVGGRKNRKRIAMARLLMSVTDRRMRVDHKNHDTLDNRKENLRVCTHAENLRNMKKSTLKGVTRKRKKWAAQITVNYRHINLGSFATAKEAAAAYDSAATKHFGDFACTNNEAGLL